MPDDPITTRAAGVPTAARPAPTPGSAGARLLESLLSRVRYRDARQTLRQVAPYVRAGDRVLDLGCGTGIVGALLEEEHGCHTIGCDVAPMNTALRDFRLFDGDHVPFASGYFDVVLLAYVLHHVPDPSLLVREAARVATRTVIVLEDTPMTWADRLWGRIHVCGFNGLYHLPHARVRTQGAWHQMFARVGMRLETCTPLRRVDRFPPIARTQFVMAPRQSGSGSES